MKIYRPFPAIGQACIGDRGRPDGARFSHLVHDLSGVIETMDINPVIVHETAAVAADALVTASPAADDRLFPQGVLPQGFFPQGLFPQAALPQCGHCRRFFA